MAHLVWWNLLYICSCNHNIIRNKKPFVLDSVLKYHWLPGDGLITIQMRNTITSPNYIDSGFLTSYSNNIIVKQSHFAWMMKCEGEDLTDICRFVLRDDWSHPLCSSKINFTKKPLWLHTQCYLMCSSWHHSRKIL